MANKKKVGRPTLFNRKIMKTICLRLANGESLRTICKDGVMPSRQTVYDWLLSNKEFLDQYESSRNIGYDEIFEGLAEIADLTTEEIVGDDKSDGARVQARRLQVDVRKWYLSKVLPKKFGDKLDVTSDNKPIPLLHVLNNNSDAKDTSPSKKD